MQENLSAQIRSLVMGLEKEMRTANSTVSALQQDVEQLRQRFQMLTRKETEYHQLKREVETNRNIYDTFLSRSKETEVTSDFNSPIARFTDYAYQPTNPAKPNRKLIVVLAFVATLGFGIVLAFLTDALNDTLNNAEEVENKPSVTARSVAELTSSNVNRCQRTPSLIKVSWLLRRRCALLERRWYSVRWTVTIK